MRVLIVGLGVALLATAPVMAAGPSDWGIISLETPGSSYDPTGNCQTGGEANVIDCNDLDLNGSGNWYLDIMVSSSDPNGMASFSITLGSPNCTPGYLGVETMMSNVLNYCGQYANYASRPGMTDQGWDMPNGVQFAAGSVPMAGPPDDTVGTITLGEEPFAQNGQAAWLEMLPLDCIDPFCCCIDESGGYYNVGLSDYSNVRPENVQISPLCITPEPASLLLLLVGLPFLRRRRC